MNKETAAKVGRIIRDVAPTLAAELIPGGNLAGRAIREVSQVLTGRPDASPHIIEEQAQDLSPEQVTALEALEATRARREEIAAGDRADAREMVEMTDSKIAGRLAYLNFAAISLITAGLFVMAYLRIEPSPLLTGLIGTAFGAFLARNEQIGNFFFGSSVGSKKKTNMLNRGSRHGQ